MTHGITVNYFLASSASTTFRQLIRNETSSSANLHQVQNPFAKRFYFHLCRLCDAHFFPLSHSTVYVNVKDLSQCSVNLAVATWFLCFQLRFTHHGCVVIVLPASQPRVLTTPEKETFPKPQTFPIKITRFPSRVHEKNFFRFLLS